MAEARSAVAEPRVLKLEEGKDSWRDFITASRRSIIRRYYRTRNSIRNGLWPTSIYNLGTAVFVIFTILLGDFPFTETLNKQLWRLDQILYLPESLPRSLKAVFLAWIEGVVFFIVLMYVRRYLLQALLTYHGWMYEQPKRPSIISLIWSLVVRLISGYNPSLYSYQRSLPRMPVPPLKETMFKLIESLEPLMTPDELEQLKIQAKEFEKKLGPKLQRILVLRSWWATNWVSDWWEKYIYLMSRSPIAINSNYYILDQSYWKPTSCQIARAAMFIYQIQLFKRLVDREQLQPIVLRSTVPLCMAQYERIFSSVRIPGEDIDELVHYESKDSKHVAVLRKGIFYKLDVFDGNGYMVNPELIEEQLKYIMDDADKHEDSLSKEEKALPALTALGRTDWAKIRSQYFSSGVNKDSIEVIDKAVCCIVLMNESPQDTSDQAKMVMHADGKSIWFDKCISGLFFPNGRFGINCEHSIADAPALAHMIEFIMTNEVLNRLYNEVTGHCMLMTNIRNTNVKQPTRLLWEVPSSLANSISKAIVFNHKNNADIDLVIGDHDSYGKGFIKTCKISPDAYIQLALQLAYFKDAKKAAMTYESSMTRLYLCGRTETVRSLTKDSFAFVRAMEENIKTKEEKIHLLSVAADRHQKLYRDAMNGKGLDRHLFALYVVCKGRGYESDFLKTALTRPWTLSTSQQPQQQIESSPDCSHPHFQDKVSPGGGFGPVSDSGYGISYMIAGENKIFFHVSSKLSALETDSKRFLTNIFLSLQEMRQLYLR